MDSLNFRHPISELVSVHPESRNFAKQVASISTKYYAWRSVVGDGNCLYRCIIRTMLEHFCRPFSKAAELEWFYKLVRNQVSGHVFDGCEESDLVVVLVLERLLRLKENHDSQLMNKVEHLLASESFVFFLISLLRRVSKQTFLIEKPDVFYYEGIEEELELIATMGSISGQNDYIAQSLMFHFDFTEVELGASNYEVITNVYSCRRKTPEWNKRIMLHVALINGHHYVLYPKELELFERMDGREYVALQDETEESCRRYEEFATSPEEEE